MMIAFILLLAGLGAIYVRAHKKYREFIAPVDGMRYRLKALLPIGLYIMEAVGYSFATGYDVKLLPKIIEISGLQHCRYYLRIHWANKLTAMLLSLAGVTFVGAVSKVDTGYVFFGISLLGAVFYFTDKELDDRIRKRRADIRLDFPDFLNKLILLINAGMTVSRAWEKVVADSRKKGVLYEELASAGADIKAGKPEHRAYEEFAKRCRTPEITRFISVVLQNLRKGSSEIVPVLRVHANECWEMRKNTARKLGEEASTKMLLPMMLMFLAVLIIVAAPAILALNGI